MSPSLILAMAPDYDLHAKSGRCRPVDDHVVRQLAIGLLRRRFHPKPRFPPASFCKYFQDVQYAASSIKARIMNLMEEGEM